MATTLTVRAALALFLILAPLAGAVPASAEQPQAVNALQQPEGVSGASLEADPAQTAENDTSDNSTDGDSGDNASDGDGNESDDGNDIVDDVADQLTAPADRFDQWTQDVGNEVNNATTCKYYQDNGSSVLGSGPGTLSGCKLFVATGIADKCQGDGYGVCVSGDRREQIVANAGSPANCNYENAYYQATGHHKTPGEMTAEEESLVTQRCKLRAEEFINTVETAAQDDNKWVPFPLRHPDVWLFSKAVDTINRLGVLISSEPYVEFFFGLPAPGYVTDPLSWINPPSDKWGDLRAASNLVAGLAGIMLLPALMLAFGEGGATSRRRKRNRRKAFIRVGKGFTIVAFGWLLWPFLAHLTTEVGRQLAPAQGQLIQAPTSGSALGIAGLVLILAIVVLNISILLKGLVTVTILYISGFVIGVFFPLVGGLMAQKNKTLQYAGKGMFGAFMLIALMKFIAVLTLKIAGIVQQSFGPLPSLFIVVACLYLGLIYLPVMAVGRVIPMMLSGVGSGTQGKVRSAAKSGGGKIKQGAKGAGSRAKEKWNDRGDDRGGQTTLDDY